jgi:hypothetical protein
MRNLIVFVFLFCAMPFCADAQDRLITKSGDVMNVYSVEIGSNSVFYKSSDKADAPIRSIAKNLVLMIKHKDGTVSNLYQDAGDKAENNPQTPAQPSSIPTMQQDDEQDEAINKQLIAEVNGDDVKYIGKNKGKGSKRVFCQYFASDDSKLGNKDITVHYLSGILYDVSSVFSNGKNDKFEWKEDWSLLKFSWNYKFEFPAVKVAIENKTDKTMYIDLGNTFFILGQESTAFYVPSSTTTSSTNSGGVGVNLGNVASALGVGGAAGTLAGGINVGGGKSNQSASTVYAQRVIAIPPKSVKTLEQVHKIGNGFPLICVGGYRFIDNAAVVKLSCGDEQLVNTQIAMPWGTMVTYSFTENCAETKRLQADFAVRRIVGARESDLSDVSDNYKTKVYTVAFAD